ncbi:MAG: hypothetical protein E7256_00465 [Lachnospiraceae bacterium]|nr:hypothetical protein [Lachnospiraceae bacterium]
MEPVNREENSMDMIEIEDAKSTDSKESNFYADKNMESGQWDTERNRNSSSGYYKEASRKDEKPVKYRRVGTITMGISLILTGIIVICALFKQDFDIMLVVKCAPVILIALGVEILVQYFRANSGKIKYDILSVLVCGTLIFGSLGFAVASPFLAYLSPERQAKETMIAKEFEQEVYERLSGLSIVDNAHTSMGLDFTFPNSITLDTANMYCDYANVSVALNVIPKSKEEFASYVSQVRDALANLSVKDVSIYVYAKEDTNENGEVVSYSIDMNSRYSGNKTLEQITGAVVVENYYNYD